MTDIKVNVLRTVRVAHPGTVYGREIVKDTIDVVPAEQFDDLRAAGYVEAQEGEVEPAKSEDPDLHKMTKLELEAFAAEKGIDISAAKNKAEAVEIIKAAVSASI